MRGWVETRTVVDDASDFGRVAVLMGGHSAERDVSLMSGHAVVEALIRRDVDADGLDAADDRHDRLLDGYDRVWIALHGRGGEDGILQGALQQHGMRYTGSGVLGCALSMDKLRSKQLFVANGFKTPRFAVLYSPEDFDEAIETVGLPLIVKPSREGSSIGLAKVEEASELPAAYRQAAKLDDTVIAETWITGPEYTAAILAGEQFPLIRIETPNTFYDYEAKYFSNDTQYICPCGVDKDREIALIEEAEDVFASLDGSGWGRVDFMLDDSGQPLFLEINTVPGMTSHSLVPIAARESGIDFDELVWRVLETSMGNRP